jgi:hypothetical protein
MICLNVALSAAQADVSDDSIDRTVEHISAYPAFKSYVEEASQRFLADSDEAGHLFQYEAGRLFQYEAGHCFRFDAGHWLRASGS